MQNNIPTFSKSYSTLELDECNKSDEQIKDSNQNTLYFNNSSTSFMYLVKFESHTNLRNYT